MIYILCIEMKDIIIWWSSWDYYRIFSWKNTDEEILKNFALPIANTMEIMFHNKEDIAHNLSKEIIEKAFVFCSLHAPAYTYQDDEHSHSILKNIKQLCSIFPIKNIVVHPDQVVDRSVFKQYSHLPFSVENMDERKTTWRSVSDIKKILDENPNLWFTFDLQHCYVNDPTMQLAKDFHKELWDRIVEYHIAWYHSELLHYPLFKTHQDIIIQAIEKTDVPIIIESTFDKAGELQKEIEYIKKVIAKNSEAI